MRELKYKGISDLCKSGRLLSRRLTGFRLDGGSAILQVHTVVETLRCYQEHCRCFVLVFNTLI